MPALEHVCLGAAAEVPQVEVQANDCFIVPFVFREVAKLVGDVDGHTSSAAVSCLVMCAEER